MATDDAVAKPVLRDGPRSQSLKFREREDHARNERRQQAAIEAAGLFRAATATGAAEHPVGVRAVILLCEAIQADHATLMIVDADEGRLCRVTRGSASLAPKSARVDIERVWPAPTPTPTPLHPVIGATSSFHALLYPPGSAQPLGCLSLYSRKDLSLTAGRLAFIDAVAKLLARELTGAALPDPTST